MLTVTPVPLRAVEHIVSNASLRFLPPLLRAYRRHAQLHRPTIALLRDTRPATASSRCLAWAGAGTVTGGAPR